MSDSFATWLASLDAERGPPIAELLRGLPGKAVYEGRPAPRDWNDEALAASELSLREGEPGLRLSFSVDPARAADGAVAHVLRKLGADPDATRAVTGRHCLVGVGWPRTRSTPLAKLYVFADRDAPGAFTDDALRIADRVGAGAWAERALTLGAPAFAALDLGAETSGAVKLYFEHRDRAAAARQLEAPAPELSRKAQELPAPDPRSAVPFVVTLRGDASGDVDTTLHFRAEPEGVADLAGQELATSLHTLSEHARGLGLRLQTTYLSWMQRRDGHETRTLYYQLWGERGA